MTVKELCVKLELRVFCCDKALNNNVEGAYVSDLLSDVMGNAEEGQVWITLQSHLNVVAIASLKELSAIILVNNIEPEDTALQKAEEEGIPVLGTALSTFEVTGRIYNMLN